MRIDTVFHTDKPIIKPFYPISRCDVNKVPFMPFGILFWWEILLTQIGLYFRKQKYITRCQVGECILSSIFFSPSKSQLSDRVKARILIVQDDDNIRQMNGHIPISIHSSLKLQYPHVSFCHRKKLSAFKRFIRSPLSVVMTNLEIPKRLISSLFLIRIYKSIFRHLIRYSTTNLAPFL